MSTFLIEGDFDWVKCGQPNTARIHTATVKMALEWYFTVPGSGDWSFGLQIVGDGHAGGGFPFAGNIIVQVRGGASGLGSFPTWTTIVDRGIVISGSDATPRPWSLSLSLDDTTGDLTYDITDPDGVNYTGTEASVCPGSLSGTAQTNSFHTDQRVVFWDLNAAYTVRHRINRAAFSEDGTIIVEEDFPDTSFDPPWEAESSSDNAPWATWGVSDSDYLHMQTQASAGYEWSSTSLYLTLLNVIPAAFVRDSISMKLVSPTEVVCARYPRTVPGSEATQVEYTRLWKDGSRDVSFPSQDYAAQSAGGVCLLQLGPELFGSLVMDSVDGTQTGVGVRVDRASPTAWEFSTAASALAIPGECKWAETVALPGGTGFLMVMQVDVGGSLDLYHTVATDRYAGNLIFIEPVKTGPGGIDLPSASMRMLPTGEWLFASILLGAAVVIKFGWVDGTGVIAGGSGSLPVVADAQQIEIEQTVSLLIAMVLLESGGVYTWNQICGVWVDETTINWSTVEVATGIDPSANVRGSLVSLPDGALLFAIIDDAGDTRYYRCEWMPADATGTWTEVVAP
jgi:hypothetical protein